VPYVRHTDWSSTQVDDSAGAFPPFPKLTLDVVNISTSGDSTSPAIPYIVYMAAGEDFEFRLPITVLGQITGGGNIEGKGCSEGAFTPEQDFRAQFDEFPGVKGSNSRYQLEPPIDSLEALLSRWSLYGYFGGDTGGAILLNSSPELAPYCGTTPNVDPNTWTSNRHLICSLFMFWSGDMDYRIIYRRIGTSDAGGSYPGDIGVCTWGTHQNSGTTGVSLQYPDNGIMMGSIDHWTNQQVSVPSVSQWAVYQTDFFQESTPTQSTVPEQHFVGIQTYADGLFTSIDTIYWRSGKGFRLFRYLPIPSYVFWPTQKFFTSTVKRPVVELQRYSAMHPHGKSDQICSLVSYPLPCKKVSGKEKDKTRKGTRVTTR